MMWFELPTPTPTHPRQSTLTPTPTQTSYFFINFPMGEVNEASIMKMLNAWLKNNHL